MKLLTLVFLLLTASMAYAAPVGLEWDCFTCDADGVSQFNLYHDTESHPDVTEPPDLYPDIIPISDGGARTFSLDLPIGYHCFRLTAGNGELESIFSNEACAFLLPRGPEGLRFLD